MLALVIWQNHFASVGVSSKEAMRGMAAKAMCGLRTALAACGVLVLATAAAEDMAYSVTVTGACKSQMFAGWDDCQGTATYTAFKNIRPSRTANITSASSIRITTSTFLLAARIASSM